MREYDASMSYAAATFLSTSGKATAMTTRPSTASATIVSSPMVRMRRQLRFFRFFGTGVAAAAPDDVPGDGGSGAGSVFSALVGIVSLTGHLRPLEAAVLRARWSAASGRHRWLRSALSTGPAGRTAPAPGPGPAATRTRAPAPTARRPPGM